ncbi:MAG: hypothetical protein FWF76_06220 [Oscillospiraceae bacterium]|nr:hypothetical protein [Oscillospiraceae bacterium]
MKNKQDKLQEWGELFHHITFWFAVDDEKMNELRIEIEMAVADILHNNIDNPLISQIGLSAFAFVGAGPPVLVPVVETGNSQWTRIVVPSPLHSTQEFTLEQAQAWANIVGEYLVPLQLSNLQSA